MIRIRDGFARNIRPRTHREGGRERERDFDGPMTWLEVKILLSHWRVSGAMTTFYLVEVDEDVVPHAKHVSDPSSARRRVTRHLTPPSV